MANQLDEEIVTILLPVMNEITSLNLTIQRIRLENKQNKFDFLVILSPKSEISAVNNAHELVKEYPNDVRVLTQIHPMLGGALADGFQNAKGAKVIMMASDLETDPSSVKHLIEMSNLHPGAIVVTTRWKGNSAGFQGYSPIKKVLNKIFQLFIQISYQTRLSDLTYGFRLYPTAKVLDRDWTTTNFAFLLESILVFLRQREEIIEISTKWKARVEGASNNSWKYFITYFTLAAKIRIMK